MSAGTQRKSTPERAGQLEVVWEEAESFSESGSHLNPPSIKISRIALSFPAIYKGKFEIGEQRENKIS